MTSGSPGFGASFKWACPWRGPRRFAQEVLVLSEPGALVPTRAGLFPFIRVYLFGGGGGGRRALASGQLCFRAPPAGEACVLLPCWHSGISSSYMQIQLG